VVADDSPAFFLPRMLRAAAARVAARLEAVDGNGLLPLAATDRAHPTAYAFRRHLQRTLPAHLGAAPAADPLRAAAGLPAARLPAAVARRWPRAPLDRLAAAGALAALPLDHGVAPAPLRGGPAAGARALDRFLAGGLAGYAERRNDPAEGSGSGLSAYLHFGHVGAHQVLRGVLGAEGLRAPPTPGPARGAREGWWGLSRGAEAFLDQAVVWRELGLHFARHRPDHATYGALPEWARRTLDAHRADPREPPWSPGRLEAADSGDEVWNAAQRELVRHGRIHNYLRMLWGKRVLGWAPSPEEALETLFRLNDRHALDGRDPNSSTGIAWCLGRFDRPWGPERPVFGTVRYMSTESTRRKFRLGGYLRAHGPDGGAR
jgi:deoxyribodipyrimidine photo-lyase